MKDNSVAESPAPAAARVRKICVVLNRSAGALVGQEDATDAIRDAFAAHEVAAEFIPIDAGDLPARLALARDSGADAVVVAGGDGTIACAATVLAGGDAPLGILPSGTMNLLAQDLAIPIGDVAAAVRLIAEGATRAIDVGDVNGHVFLCASMTGLPTRLARHREAGRGGPVMRLWGRFARAALRVLAASRRMRVTLAVDGATRRVRTPSLTVSVNRLGGERQFGRARLDDGELGIYVVGRLGFGDASRMALAAALGRLWRDKGIEESFGREVAVISTRPAMRVLNDGETLLLQTPLRYTIRPRALKVIAGS